MQVLKVVAEGSITSFRYPHFMQGVQPTFEMPPPATIYGHLCSTLGEWVDPEGIQFAYRFTFERKLSDLEHVHILAPAGGKLEGTDLPKVIEGHVNPFKRELLFNPKLTLYINRPEWEGAFRHPRYAVVLGRSQDLFTYTSVKVITLQPAERAYFEHTLVPYRFAPKFMRGVSILMPRFLDYENKRTPTFAGYVILRGQAFSDELNDVRHVSKDQPDSYWVDPESPQVKGANLGLLFHRFVGDDEQTFRMA